MEITKSSRLFLERVGLAETRRMPTPRVAPMAMPIHSAETPRPLPHADFVTNDTPTDGPLTIDPWPHGPADV